MQNAPVGNPRLLMPRYLDMPGRGARGFFSARWLAPVGLAGKWHRLPRHRSGDQIPGMARYDDLLTIEIVVNRIARRENEFRFLHPAMPMVQRSPKDTRAMFVPD